MKVHVLNKIAEVGLAEFGERYEFAEHQEEADLILVRSADMKELSFGEGLLAVGRAGAGVNNIPIDRCSEQGIVVFNTPGANSNAVKELVIAGLLLASRDIVSGINRVFALKDEKDIAERVEKEKSRFAGTELYGKKLGVIDLGGIGVLVANAADSLGMEVYGADPYISVEHAWNLSGKVIHVKDQNEIYENCDYITVHVPLSKETKEMIGADSFSRMKEGVVLLNFSRDGLVREASLKEALENGKVRRYVTDFPNERVLSMKNTIVIPHLGASTKESEDNCAIMAVRALTDYAENGNIKNSVNFPDVDAGVCKSKGRIVILHKNIPKMIARFTKVFSEDNINIEELLGKSKGDYAVTVFDLDVSLEEHIIGELRKTEGVLKVRKIK